MARAAPLIGPHYGAGPVELTVVGDADPEAVVAAVARTLGALPARRAAEAHAERRRVAALPHGLRMVRTIATQDRKCSIFLFYPLSDGFDPRTRRLLGLLGLVVNDRLRVEVRERLGAAYAPSAATDLSRVFPGFGLLLVQASGDPSKAEELLAACRQAVAGLAEGGVGEEELARLVAPLLNQIRDQRRTNEYWLRELGEAQSAPASLDNPRTVLGFYEALDRAELNALATRYLRADASSALVVLPE
jgi:zinc protease